MIWKHLPQTDLSRHQARLPELEEALPALKSMIADLRGAPGNCLVLILHRGLERILELEPRIPVLHLVRDPRDVARSAIGMGWAGNVYYGARTWLVTEREWENTAAKLYPDQSIDFFYEELVSSPEETLRKLCTFLKVEYDPAMLSYPESSTYSAVDASLAEQWKRKQTPRELGLSEPLFGELLTKRGYEPSGHPQIIPGLGERLRLRVEHSASVWRRRVERYGLRDPLIVSFCHKLGVPKWARPAQKRMDFITKQYLK